MMRARTVALPVAFVLAMALLTGCMGTGTAQPRPERLTDALDQIVQRWHERAWVPGVAVSVRQDGALTWSTVAGYADEDAETPMEPDMSFSIASVTKPFVAATVLTLVEDGMVDLEDPLSDYVGFPTSGRVSLRQLLAMRSGFPTTPRHTGSPERVLDPLGLEHTMLPHDEEPPALAAGHTDLDRDATRDSLAELLLRRLVQQPDGSADDLRPSPTRR